MLYFHNEHQIPKGEEGLSRSNSSEFIFFLLLLLLLCAGRRRAGRAGPPTARRACALAWNLLTARILPLTNFIRAFSPVDVNIIVHKAVKHFWPLICQGAAPFRQIPICLVKTWLYSSEVSSPLQLSIYLTLYKCARSIFPGFNCIFSLKRVKRQIFMPLKTQRGWLTDRNSGQSHEFSILP